MNDNLGEVVCTNCDADDLGGTACGAHGTLTAQATAATRADEHGPDWSDRPEGAEDSCKCGFNGTAVECAASRAATRADTPAEVQS